MDKDEVEDVGIPVEGLLDSNIIEMTAKLLRETGNMVGYLLQSDAAFC
jgi:hypothetical protein